MPPSADADPARTLLNNGLSGRYRVRDVRSRNTISPAILCRVQRLVRSPHDLRKIGRALGHCQADTDGQAG
jgi:hypothetical protein